MELIEKYVAVHRQGFLPIFVKDEFDAVMLADACVEAGAEAIEITCRRPGVVKEIRAIKEKHPELLVLVGSTIDDENLVQYIKRRQPEFPSLDELAALDIDGFVSIAKFGAETVKRYSKDFLVMPGVETLGESFEMMKSGAHFVKFFTTSLYGGTTYIRLCTNAATQHLAPVFVTGGVTPEKIYEYTGAGAVMFGAGFDLIVKDHYMQLQQQPDKTPIVAAFKKNLEAVKGARSKHIPGLIEKYDAPVDEYLDAIHHYHPFSKCCG